MREILFRGKRIDNGEWIEGYYAAEPYMKSTYNYGYILENEKDLYAKKAYFVDSRTVGQFTGLTDKNGKKIFEGDIIRQKGFLNNYYTAVWYASGRFLVKDYETLLPTELGGISRYKIEVIGNIHDNPELLEVTE